jgi:hypothetical protein
LLNVTITEDVERALDELVERLWGPGIDGGARAEILASPVVAIGSLDYVCEKLLDTRETFGLSYFESPVDAEPETLAPVIERLADS